MRNLARASRYVKRRKWNRLAIGERRVKVPTVLAFVALHAVAGYALWRAFSPGYSWIMWVMFAAVGAFTTFGTTLGYHRLLTHRSFHCKSRVLRCLLAIAGGMSGQGREIGWVPVHRVHHVYEDQQGKDPHTPEEYSGLKGLLWAHMGWMFFEFNGLIKEQVERVRTKFLDPRYMRPFDAKVASWQAKLIVPLVVVPGFLVPAAVGYLFSGAKGALDALLLVGFLRLVFTLHVAWSVNSVGHMFGSPAKYPCGCPYVKVDARNNALLLPVSGGEWGHGNHHYDQTCAYFAEYLDPGKWLLEFFEKVGWVDSINKKPKIRGCPEHGKVGSTETIGPSA